MKPCPRRATRNSEDTCQLPASSSQLSARAETAVGARSADNEALQAGSKFQQPAIRAGSWKLSCSERLALPRRRVPPQDAILLHRFEREQGRQCRVVTDLHRRIGLPVLRLQFVEEVARVHVQRVILFDAAARVD